MEDIQYKWLPHLEDAVPSAGQGKRISTYTVALEGWRRGMTLKFYRVIEEGYKLKIRYALSYQGNEHHFALSKGDKVTDEAFYICEDKHLTKEYLAKAGVPVPQGEKFAADIPDDEIIDYANSLGYPLALKPVSANGGKGVFANVQNKEELRKALPYVRRELEYPEVIIEEHVPGTKEFRIIVLEDKVLGAMNRIPANIVGDGQNTIKRLIDIKNELRKKNPHLTSRLIKIDMEVMNLIQAAGYTLDSIPPKGERIFLREQSNLSNGGDSLDVTNELTPEMERIALEATQAIPGLAQSGVDMIVDPEKSDSGVVIEINSRPGLGGHLFPVEGKPRDFAKEFIDYYFPETKDIERSNLYFNFNKILKPLKSRSAVSVELPPPPQGKLYGKRYIVLGHVQGVGFRKWIKKKALQKNLHGYAKNLLNGDVEVVVAGTKKKAVNEFKDTCFEGPEKAKVEEVIEYDWDKPIKMGFQMKKARTKSLKKIEKEYELISKEYTKIKNSTSWRLTYPVRYVLDVVKRIIKPNVKG